jgi:hypothetical protein
MNTEVDNLITENDSAVKSAEDQLPPESLDSQEPFQPFFHCTTEDGVVDLLLHNPKYVEEAILLIYREQENEEKVLRKTISRNRVGFNTVDARVFSEMAERILSGQPLSAEDLETCRKMTKNGVPRIARYRRQLLNVANPARGGVQ